MDNRQDKMVNFYHMFTIGQALSLAHFLQGPSTGFESQWQEERDEHNWVGGIFEKNDISSV